MTADNFKVEFFKNRILNRLEELKPFMSGVKYRLYTSMINDCSSLDEIRDMAELDMQFNMIRYIRELDDKLKLSNTNIEELEAVTNQNVKAAKLTIISPQKKVKKEVSMYEDFDFSTLGEDLEDDDLLASAANLLMMRFNNEPADVSLNNLDNEEEFSESDIDEIDDTDEDFYSAEYDNEDTDESEEDDFEIEDYFEIEDAFDIEGDFEEDIENEADDFEIDGDFEDFDEDFEDTEVTSEVNEDDEIIDFGNEDGTLSDNSEDKEEEETDWDTLGDDLFNESYDIEEDEDDIDWDTLGDDMFAEDDSFEDKNDIDWDSMESEMLGDESDIEDYDDEETDWDTLGDDMFAESDNFEDDESEETDWDTLGDDMFEESDDFDDNEYDEESDEETNWDTLGDDAFDEEDLDSEYEDTDEEDEDAFDSIDNISADDLFSDVDDESFEDVSESSDNIDDMFDIDESELGFDSNDTSDNFDDFFNRNTTKQNSQKYNSKDRVVTVDKVFINGTKRGNQTQQMFNLLNSIFDNTGKFAKKTISTARSSQNTNRGNGHAVKRHI